MVKSGNAKKGRKAKKSRMNEGSSTGQKSDLKAPADEGRVSTGVPGLDGVMNGGFRRNTVNLIAGGPGSGKTIFGIQFLVDGIENHNETGVYISFEQTEEELLSDMKVFKWNLQDKIENKKMVILSYTPEQVEKVLKAGGGIIRDIIQNINARRVVLDSLTAFTLLYERLSEQRKACLSLFRAIKKWNCTALLIAEQEGTPEVHTPSVEEFEVDGVVLLYNIRTGYIRQRALEVFKMRGARHPVNIFPLIIDDKGMKILPKKSVF
jgi:circadian clock protein KaiC